MAERQLARRREAAGLVALVRWLEDLVRVPGTKFGIGLDAILGLLLPGFGDAITGTASVAVLVAAMRRGVPRVVVARMFVNIAIDVFVGMIPVVGDAFDVLWRSNTRNLALLERHENELEPHARRIDYAIVAAAIAVVGLGIAAPIFVVVWLVGWLMG
jgi:hypothetical protein